MIIEHIELSNFRNYEKLSLSLDPGTTIFYGDNAQGKTNILESIYLAAMTRSHRGSKDKEMLRFECDEGHIRMMVRKQGIPYRIDMHLKRNKAKGIAINEVPIRRASELFGIVNVVCFSPENLDMVKKGPAERRSFLNTELCQINRLYMEDLSAYGKVLEQRNRLLKEIDRRRDYADMLQVWDDQLVSYGLRIIQERRKFIDFMNEIIPGIHRGITGGREEIFVKYEPYVTEEDFPRLLRERRERDYALRSTSVGPHKDDFAILVNDIDLRRYGSQGQQRTAALSIKLSEIEILKIRTKDTPILLLDDVLSELDRHRQNDLLKSIENIQTLITCTGLEDFVEHQFPVHRVYEVCAGTVQVKNQEA